jgi:arginyl-tRNA synthetase
MLKSLLEKFKYVKRIKKAIEESKDFVEKARAFAAKYEDADDDAKALLREAQEAKEAWANVL